jgi:hypothetical protein
LPVHALVMTVAALLSLANAGTATTHPNRNAERNPTRALAGLAGGGVLQTFYNELPEQSKANVICDFLNLAANDSSEHCCLFALGA